MIQRRWHRNEGPRDQRRIPVDIRLALWTLLLVPVLGCSTGRDPATADGAETTSLATAPGRTTPGSGPAPSTGTGPTPSSTDPAPVIGVLGVEIIAVHPHDPTAYTQGLEWHAGRLLESTGQYGESSRRWVEVDSGRVETEVLLDDDLFGEGLTIVGDDVLQLTWREGRLLRSSLGDLELDETVRYDGEGWGLCFDGARVIRSDGTDRLTIHDPDSFAVIGWIQVTDRNGPIERLNELECVGDQILANVYGLDSVLAIDATNGSVVGVIDAAALRPAGAPAEDLDYVLNGIAHRLETDTYFLTGKFWPVVYEVKLVPG